MQTFNDPVKAALIEEFRACDSAEDRLTWLIERVPFHSKLPETVCTPEQRVPGCLSGLWLAATLEGGRCLFSCASESSVVQGIGSLLCDLYSGHTPSEILTIGAAFSDELQLDRLLTATRRRAIATIVGFITSEARRALDGTASKTTS